MFRSLFTILIATSIFSCPLLCKSGACCGEHRAAEKTCCSHCKSDGASTTDEPTSSDHPRGPEKCRQCLCDGAVVEKSSLNELEFHQLDSHWSWPTSVLYAAVSMAGESRFELFSIPLRPEDGTNPGRALCQLYMTFQC